MASTSMHEHQVVMMNLGLFSRMLIRHVCLTDRNCSVLLCSAAKMIERCVRCH